MGPMRFLLTRAKKMIVASHMGRPGGKNESKWSLAPVRDYLERVLSSPVTLAVDCIGPEVERMVREEGQPKVILLENLRFHPEAGHHCGDYKA